MKSGKPASVSSANCLNVANGDGAKQNVNCRSLNFSTFWTNTIRRLCDIIGSF